MEIRGEAWKVVRLNVFIDEDRADLLSEQHLALFLIGNRPELVKITFF
jgi:hypothetical protein